MNVSTLIRKFRLKRGLSQEEVAHGLDMSQNGYHKIEAGKVALKVETLIAIANILETPVKDFFQESSSGTSVSMSDDELQAVKGGKTWASTREQWAVVLKKGVGYFTHSWRAQLSVRYQ